MSETCCARLAENTGRKKSPSRHHHATLSGHIFATKARIDNLKNKNSSGDEIANVNFFYNIAHVEASAYAH